MGLFDEIIFEEAILHPESGEVLEGFQTKSLDNVLQEYKVKKDRLLIAKYEFTKISEEKIPTKKVIDWEDTNYNGVIECHTITNNGNEWVSMTLKFTNGKLIEKKIDITKR